MILVSVRTKRDTFGFKEKIFRMKLKFKSNGKQSQRTVKSLSEKSDFKIQTDDMSMRLVDKSDAKFIVDLRTDETLGQFISETSSSIENQIAWIEEYKKREAEHKEFYFIYEDSVNTKWGTIRLYNLLEDSFTLGSWICVQGNKNHIAIKSFLYALKFGFEKLGYENCQIDVRKKNIRVLYFLKLFKPVLINEDLLNWFFRLEKNTFYHNISVVNNVLNIKL